MLKSAVIGCGHIGPHHANCYQGTREVQLAAVVDIVPERAEQVARKHGVPFYADFREVLKRKDIDIIDVCVPSGLHGTIAMAAAKAGKHCLSEKPLDVTPQRCDQIIRAFKKSGTTLGGIYQHRFADDSGRAKAAIEAGRLGHITLATCSTNWWRTQEYYDSGDWRGTWKLDGGGCLMNQGIHAIDLLVWLAGPVRSVTARTALLGHERIEVEDVAVATVEFASGALGIIQGTTTVFPGAAVRHEIMGTDGMIYLEDDVATLWKFRSETPADKPAGKPAIRPVGAAGVGAAAHWSNLSNDIFVRCMDNFARAIREGQPPLVTGEEHKKAVEVICAIYQSARTGKTVTLPLKRFKPKA